MKSCRQAEEEPVQSSGRFTHVIEAGRVEVGVVAAGRSGEFVATTAEHATVPTRAAGDAVDSLWDDNEA
jgi:hypothetical protein